MSEVTSIELRNVQTDLVDRLEEITAEMRRGFDGVYQRQDKTNGRLMAAEGSLANHRELLASTNAKVKNLEREVFDERRSGLERRETPAEPEGQGRKITQRDVLVFIAGAGLIWTLLKAIRELAPLLGIGK